MATMEKKVEVLEVSLTAKFTEITDTVSLANDYIVSGDIKKLEQCEETLKEKLAEYNEMLRYMEYDKWLSQEEPMLLALKQGWIDQSSAVKKPLVKDGIPKYAIVTKKVIVNIIEFIDYAKKETKKTIIVNGQWKDRLAHWRNALISYNAGQIEDKLAVMEIKEIVKFLQDDEMQFEFNGSSVSKTSLKKTGQIILDSIVKGVVTDSKGNEKPFIFEGKDLEFIARHSFKASNKALTASSAPRFETILAMFTRAMHRIVTNGEYKQEM